MTQRISPVRVETKADQQHLRLIAFQQGRNQGLHESQKTFGPLAEAMIAQGRITGSIWLDIKVKAEQKMKSAVLKDLLEVKS